MTILRAFIYQSILFFIFVAALFYRARIRKETKLSNLFPPIADPNFAIFLLWLWFGVMTYARMYYDWPLLGIYSHLIPELNGNMTTNEVTKKAILFLVVLAYLITKLIFFYDEEDIISWLKNKYLLSGIVLTCCGISAWYYVQWYF